MRVNCPLLSSHKQASRHPARTLDYGKQASLHPVPCFCLSNTAPCHRKCSLGGFSYSPSLSASSLYYSMVRFGLLLPLGSLAADHEEHRTRDYLKINGKGIIKLRTDVLTLLPVPGLLALVHFTCKLARLG